METSINYINVKPSLYLPPTSNTEDEGRGSLRDIRNALHIKMIAREKLITLKLTYRLQILLAGTKKVRTP